MMLPPTAHHADARARGSAPCGSLSRGSSAVRARGSAGGRAAREGAHTPRFGAVKHPEADPSSERCAAGGRSGGGAGAGGGEARTFYRNSLRAHSPRIARSSPSAAAGATLRQRQRELFLVRLPYSSRSGVGLARTCHARRGRSAAAYFYYASACPKRWAGPCTTCTCRRPSTPPSQGRESAAA